MSQIREAQEALCDETRRSEYDKNYHLIQLQWLQYRRELDAQQAMKRQREIEEERIRQKAAEETTKRAAEAEKMRKIKEEEQLEAERVTRQKLRAQREREAEERSREAGRKAQEQHERDAKERLRKYHERKAEQEREAMERQQKDKERRAEERSKEAGKKMREQQEKEAKERLSQILAEERLGNIRRDWTNLREQAELRNLNSVGSPDLTFDQFESTCLMVCIHPQIGWPRKNGSAHCDFCKKKCAKYSFRCPNCNIAACIPCKQQRCLY